MRVRGGEESATVYGSWLECRDQDPYKSQCSLGLHVPRNTSFSYESHMRNVGQDGKHILWDKEETQTPLPLVREMSHTGEWVGRGHGFRTHNLLSPGGCCPQLSHTGRPKECE